MTTVVIIAVAAVAYFGVMLLAWSLCCMAGLHDEDRR